jgi:hypothetical protein
MEKQQEYRERCAARGLDEGAVEKAVAFVEALETEARGRDGSLATVTIATVERHIAALVAGGEADENRILALARYFSVCGANAIAIRLLAYLLPIGVLPSMAERIAAVECPAARERIMAALAVPPVGSPPEAYPRATASFVDALERELGAERSKRVLAWNVHGIPAAAWAEERELWLAAPTTEAWLEGFHARQVEVLAKHAADGTLWYEQLITPRVVDFVRSNQELLSGVVEGETIYTVKIPYDPDRFLLSNDPVEKRRLACHCPLVAATITATGAGVPAIWCNCSAGYEKFKFDVIFGEETQAEVLESVIASALKAKAAGRAGP